MDCDIASYHVGSFDFLADEGVHLAAIDVPAQKFRLKNDGAVEMQYTKAELDYPHLESSSAVLFPFF
ncbi:unnamed protein product [Anisakis simplex]|uniref:DNA-directed RNA polymerase I subunit RPA2 (inferred by orthology to a human protein) n=1 Tax=Anisakis simplex TaxID=6269 RepID=A0A0M3JNJ9_ANISI|nr:unnamed protein product [Anisakis simplex]